MFFISFLESKKIGNTRALAIWMVLSSMLMPAVTALSPATEPSAFAQAAAQGNATGERFELKQLGAQTISLGRLSYDSQKAGRVKCTIQLEQGELSGRLILRMLSKDGTDLAPQAKSMGFIDPTKKFELKGLKAGSPTLIEENFVTAAQTALVSVELLADVKTAPCSLRISALSLDASTDSSIAAGAAAQDGQLVVAPVAGFAYADNLLPPADATNGDSGWKASGSGATRGKGSANQPTLILSEQAEGKWESPVAPLSGNIKSVCLQAFVKFDAIATPYEHPFEVVFRDADGKTLPLSRQLRNWHWTTWGHVYGQWIPLNMKIAVPTGATSAQVQIELAKGETVAAVWSTGAAKRRNNFGSFHIAGLALWGMPGAAADSTPVEQAAWVGGVTAPGPFVPCAALQQNSIVLTTHVNTTGNLAFDSRGQWPAPKVRVENYLPIRRSVVLNGDVFDWLGNKITQVSCPVELAPYEKKDVELPLARSERSGIFSTNLDATQDGTIVGQNVVRWGYFLQPSDRPDRHHDQYPFFFHPLFTADGGGETTGAAVDHELQTLRALGVRGVRLQCRLWSFDAAKPDESIKALSAMAEKFHAQIWPFLQQRDMESYISFFPRPSSPVPATEQELSAWREYAAASVRVYPGIKTFAFGNEEIGGSNVNLEVKPLIWGYRGSLREYIRQFLEARKAAIQARPEITYLIGQATDPQAHVARLFFEAGGKPSDLQGWAANSYNTPGPIWAKLSDTLQKNGVDVSTMTGILPEIGYDYSPRGPNRLKGEKEHAMAVIRTYLDVLTAAPWVRNITFFATVHAGVENHGVFDADWSPKPAAGAYLCMTSTLGAGRPTRVANLPGANAYLWQRPDGSKVGIIWSSGRRQMRLQVGETSQPVVVRDLMGNDTPMVPEAGVITVEVSDAPIYLLNIKTLEDGSEVAVNWTLERAPDGGRQVKADIRNRSTRSLTIDGTFEGPPDVAWLTPGFAGIQVAPGQSRVVTRRFLLMDEEIADNKALRLTLKADGVTVTNDYTSSLFTARRAAASPIADSSSHAWDNADFVRMRSLKQVINDGGVIRWTGPDDLSARCGSLWDAQNLYFRAEVKDNVNVQKTEPNRMFLNDSIQLAFTVNHSETESSHTEMSLGVSGGKPVIHVHAGKLLGLAEQYGASLRVSRDEASHATVYTAAIPWAVLNIASPTPGQRLGFSILINDSDQTDSEVRDRQGIQWFSGIYRKDSTKFGDLNLCD